MRPHTGRADIVSQEEASGIVTIIILAAGYAVRLHPLTLNMSKSLLPVGGKSILDRIMEAVTKLDSGRDAIRIVTNAKFFNDFKEWRERSKYRQRVELINDGTLTNDTRLGATKDLELAISERAVKDDLLVVAGDNLFDFNLEDFLRFARSRNDGVSIAVYDIKDLDMAKNFGVVKVGPDCSVIDFEEKPPHPESTLISTGIYYFPRAKLPLVKKFVSCSGTLDAPGHYIRWLSKEDKVYGFSFTEDWYDIGSVESYKKADEAYLRKEKVNGKR